MVADVSSQSAQFINDLDTSFSSTYTCGNAASSFNATAIDLDNSNSVLKGDDLALRYTNCNVNEAIANGDLTISVRDANGINIGNYNSGANWLFAFDVNTDLLEINANNKAFNVSGNMEISLQFDAMLASLDTEITSDRLNIEETSKNTLLNINLSQKINLASMPSNYSLTIDSLKLVNETKNTAITAIANSISFSGMELLNLNQYFVNLDAPDNGVFNLAGKNSSAEVSIMPGELVSIDVDTNGDSISDEEIFLIGEKLKNNKFNLNFVVLVSSILINLF
ncbi:MAG: hypothetical protein KJO47_02670 [Gammaproteobacteria bacterium]|nr:hypothetical protein [Gammaproteobacteria bacterium]